MLPQLTKAFAMGALALCTAVLPAHAEVTVNFWHSFGKAKGEALQQIVDNFEAKYPDIKINAQYTGGYEDIVTKLQAAIPAHREPDAVIMEVTRYGLFADRGVLTDLTPYMQNDANVDNLYDFAKEVGVFEGKNYILPFNSSTPLLYINKDIFKRAGLDPDMDLSTYDQILKAAQQIQDKLGDQGIFGIAAPGQFARWGLVMDNDTNLIDPTTNEVLLDSPNTIEAYDWMASLTNKYHVASVDTVTDEGKGPDEFVAGQTGILVWSTASLVKYHKALGDDLKVLPMPCNKVCSVPIGGAGIGIMSSASDEVKDAAYKFMSFAASPQSNAIWFAATGYMPINKLTTEQPEAAAALKNITGIDQAIKQLPVAHGRPRPPVVTWMRTTEYNVWQAIALGQRDVEDAMKDFAENTRAESERLAN